MMINDPTGARHVPREIERMSDDYKHNDRKMYVGGAAYAPSALRTENWTVKPSGFAEYDHLTGYVTGMYSSEWTDKSGTRWRTVTTVINLGRPDRGMAVDPDDAMAYETLQEDEINGYHYRNSINANAERRHSEAMQILTAYMREHGPSTMAELMPLVKWQSKASLAEHIALFPGVYRCFIMGGKSGGHRWGLQGQEYKKPERVLTGGKLLMYETLQTHGPMLANELSALTGVMIMTCRTTLFREPDWFVRVGKRQDEGWNVPQIIWGAKEAA